MKKRYTKSEKKDEHSNTIIADSFDHNDALTDPHPHFIPYACYYNENTILTKNGELLQTIKVLLPATHQKTEHFSSIIRNAINELKSTKICIWTHMVRTKHPIHEPKNHKTYPYILMHEWDLLHNWNSKIYRNELYITVLMQGMNISFTLKNLSIKSLAKTHRKYLENTNKEISEIVRQLCKKILPFRSRVLKIYIQSGYILSQHLRLFSRIMYAKNFNIPIYDRDISHEMAKCASVNFGHHTVHIKDYDNHNSVAAIYLIKSYAPLSEHHLYRLTHIDAEATFTEIINFVKNPKFKSTLSKHKQIMDASKDKSIFKMLEIDEIYKATEDSNLGTAYNQLSITIFAKNMQSLREKALELNQVATQIGISLYRLDLRIEQGFNRCKVKKNEKGKSK